MNRRQLSVIIPCHNSNRYLPEAVESVLRQETSAADWEVIVVNDHSTDCDTLEELDRWSGTDARVRVIINTGPSGPSAARNAGIEASTGEWLAFLDADDVWVPGSLQARWDIVEREPDAQWITADYLVWNEDGTVDGLGFLEKGAESRSVLSRAYESRAPIRLSRPVPQLLRMCVACTDAVMVRRDLMRQLGCFETRLRQSEDNHMWLRLASAADLFFVPKRVALYRQHGASLTHQSQAPFRWEVVAYAMLLEDPAFKPYRALVRRKLAYFHEENAYYHRSRGNATAALRSAAGILRYAPAKTAGWRQLIAAVIGRR